MFAIKRNTILLILLTTVLWSCKKEKKDQGPEAMPTVTLVRSSNWSDPQYYLGKPNNLVVVTGHNFSQDPAGSRVLFNGTSVAALDGDSTYISVTVPDEIRPGATTVTVITHGKTIVLPNTYTIATPDPQIGILTTEGAMRGAKVGLTAQDLSITQGKTTITINGTPVIIDSVVTDIVYFTIPANATDGKLVLNTRGKTLTYPRDFKIINSTFTRVSNTYVRDLTRDAAGNLYGTVDNTVVKITTAGVRSTLATIGIKGAQITHLGGCVADPAGNVYVSSPANFSPDWRSSFTSDNSKIYKISPAGAVSVLAGSVQGNADGQGANAQFMYPDYMAIDKKTGDLYVADGTVIRKITAAGLVSTLAGSATPSETPADGQGAAAKFTSIRGMVVDLDGNLLVVDGQSAKVRMVSSGGMVTTVTTTNQCCVLPASRPLSAVNLATMDAKGNLWMASDAVVSFDRMLYKFEGGAFINTFLNPSVGIIMGLTADGAGNLYLSTDNDNLYLGTVPGIYKITP